MVTVEELKEMFTSVLGEDVDLSQFTEKANLKTDVGMNSISFLYMAMVLEEKYSIQFSNEDFGKIQTVEDVISLVESKVQAK